MVGSGVAEINNDNNNNKFCGLGYRSGQVIPIRNVSSFAATADYYYSRVAVM